MTTWRKLITAEMERNGESFDDVVGMVLRRDPDAYYDQPPGEPSLDEEFDDGFGGHNGCFFTLWTKNRVYFPGVYDGAEWCASVPRNPCDEATVHIGGQ